MVDPLAPLAYQPPPLNVNALGSPKKKSLLDGLITGLFGSDTAEMTPERARQVEGQRARDQSEVGADAAAFANNPAGAAASYMKAPGVKGTGDDLLKTIGKVAKFFQKGA